MNNDKAEPGRQDLEDLEDLFENAPCGYVSVQADGRIIKSNCTFAVWMGYEHDHLVGRRFQDLLNIAGKIYYETHFAPLLRMQGFFNEVALDIVRMDGAVLPILVNAVERRALPSSTRLTAGDTSGSCWRRVTQRSGRMPNCASSIRPWRRGWLKPSGSASRRKMHCGRPKRWKPSDS